MAKDSSFDVVSEVNMQEVDNAFQQTTREISQRYDLKDSGARSSFRRATSSLRSTPRPTLSPNRLLTC